MFCSKCGNQVDQGNSYCQKCGAVVSQPLTAQPQSATAPLTSNMSVTAVKTSGMAIASLVLGIVGLFFFPFIPSILAIIFGVISIGQINRSNGVLKGKGMAVAGLVMGIIAVVLSILLIALVGLSMTWISDLANTSIHY